MIHWICWRVWKWGQLWETNGFWSCPMIFRSQKACVTRFSYQPSHVASLFHHTLCVETSFGVSKRMASYVICFFGPCTCWDERGHLTDTDTYCLVSFGFSMCWFHPDLCCFITNVVTLMQIPRQPKQWMLRVLIIPRWVSHEMFPFWGIFPRDSFPQHTWPAAWSGPGGRGSCWGP